PAGASPFPAVVYLAAGLVDATVAMRQEVVNAAQTCPPVNTDLSRRTLQCPRPLHPRECTMTAGATPVSGHAHAARVHVRPATDEDLPDLLLLWDELRRTGGRSTRDALHVAVEDIGE